MKREAGVYHTHSEVTELLHGWAEHPLCSVESLGSAADGKDVWLLTLNNASTGAAKDKPALWVDGNMHAGEVTGCEACLHLIETLLAQCPSPPHTPPLPFYPAFPSAHMPAPGAERGAERRAERRAGPKGRITRGCGMTGDAADPWTREVLGSSACYVLPRISPDGAEFMLTTPFSCRSSPIPLEPKQ